MKLTTFFGILVMIVLVALVGAVGYLFYPQVNTQEEPESFIFAGASSPYKYSFNVPAGNVDKLLKTSFGILGSVNITGAATEGFYLYNATTTNVNLRAVATSSLDVIANFERGAVEGYYNFDVAFDDGLLVVWDATPTGTSTIAYD